MLLAPSLNTPPATIRHIHLMGICGTGVGALAGMLKAEGYVVSGSDQNVYPPMSDFLAEQEIAVMAGYCPENLHPRPDLVVVGNVVTCKNPEAIALSELAIPYLSMPQALGHFFLKNKTSLVISGTHGKTTTSSLLATMLQEAGLSPGFMIGGIVQAFQSNFKVGSGQYMVVEGDEYDTAFFDKGPKFLHYQARIAVLTSIEFDHADIYDDLAAIKRSFIKLVSGMPSNGCLIAYGEDPLVCEVTRHASCEVQLYGMTAGCFWHITKIDITPNGTYFSVQKGKESYGDFLNVLPGRHNALNSLAVIAVLDKIGLSVPEIARCLPRFKGVKRRQEVRGVVNGITVMDDFAHHPTAVRETLAALRASHPTGRLIAVFEPRTNSSRRNIFQGEYPDVFDNADKILIREPVPLDNVLPDERFSAEKLVRDLQNRNLSASHYTSVEAIIADIGKNAISGDLIVIMSNGGFENIHTRLLRVLEDRC